MSVPSTEELLGKTIDVAEVREMEIEIDFERKVVYINVEGITLLRCNNAERLRLTTKQRLGTEARSVLWGEPLP